MVSEIEELGTQTGGAIGFDWVTVGVGGVPWLISRPRKKLIKQHLPKSRLLSPPN
jgi:hypothetical protein